ncbi:hypothetical protein HHK36_010028 [Tetracentron sinense]|uniref:Uncharacterized protein n=1 Tax=Tetracentron sinense TaxID=13715 RepID=A0A834ZGT7_TETSI|nr:hypothetical protein HHK36_010028 [Tetracentron sinense]
MSKPIFYGALKMEKDQRCEVWQIIDSTDVIGIMSFIPSFNLLSWVFAGLDTGRWCYGVHSIVYLAPSLRKNFSLLPHPIFIKLFKVVTTKTKL